MSVKIPEAVDVPPMQICNALEIEVLPESFRKPVMSPLPTLFISGSLDSNTPPYKAEEVRRGISPTAST